MLRALFRRLGARRCSRDPADGPEVVCETGVECVGVRHAEVACLAPVGAPRVAHDEALVRIRVADTADGVAAELLVFGLGHRHLPRLRNVGRFERREHDEAKDEGEPRGEAALEVAEVLRHAVVAARGVRLGRAVRLDWRHLRELCAVVGPQVLGADAEFVDDLNAVAERRARVVCNGALERALVVVDEEPRRRKFNEVLAARVERYCGRNGVCRARSKRTLVVDGRAFRPQVDFGRECAKEVRNVGPQVSMVGQIAAPPVARYAPRREAVLGQRVPRRLRLLHLLRRRARHLVDERPAQVAEPVPRRALLPPGCILPRRHGSAQPLAFVWDWLEVAAPIHGAGCITLNGTFMAWTRGMPSAHAQGDFSALGDPVAVVPQNTMWFSDMGLPARLRGAAASKKVV
mmetsp:Transcript_2646/g.9666  ORF Transcript_2646/g.9666 Transcript_2646/m.9666 type:complete len:404 (-) Transcript_2646:106-1317(-)